MISGHGTDLCERQQYSTAQHISMGSERQVRKLTAAVTVVRAFLAERKGRLQAAV
jgi:hypothetical protein